MHSFKKASDHGGFFCIPFVKIHLSCSMKALKRLLKYALLTTLAIPLLFLAISYLLTKITVGGNCEDQLRGNTVWLNTNGIHLDIIFPIDLVSDELIQDLVVREGERYLSFGWGEEAFYLETPTWGDLTFYNACQALLWDSTSLMHVTRHKNTRNDWVEVKLSNDQLASLNNYILNSFTTDQAGQKYLLEEPGYTPYDDFYEGEGDYSCFNTCNSWVNGAFRAADLDACLWTPFDFGLMDIHKENARLRAEE